MSESILIDKWVVIGLTIIYATIIVTAVIVVLRENRNPIRALSWVIALIFLPGIGLIFYIFFGRSLRGLQLLTRHNKRKIMHKHSPRRVDINNMSLLPDHRSLIKLSHSLCHSPFTVNNEIEIFTDGRSKFESFKRDLRNARNSILLQYYIFLDDETGREIADILIERAKAGVKVKVRYDHVGSFSARNKFFRRMEQAGIATHPFFRVNFPQLANRLNWRNHRKIAIIDGETGYIGGMNIADRYIKGPGHGQVWRDTHFRVKGDIVESLIYSFAIDWNFLKKEPYVPDVKPVQAGIANDCGVQLLTGGPTERWNNLALCFLRAIASAKKTILIQTPYFLPTDALFNALQAAALSKVDVRIMIPNHPDSRLLRYASFSYITQCLKTGIKVYLYEPGMLHSKVMIIDDALVTSGSTNFDFRSFENNFESNLLIYDEGVNRRMRDIFFNDLKQCRKVNIEKWRKRPIGQRILESMFRLVSPIL
ncbi:MAG: cardiolipin synthase [Muribaculaceae bacterium]|nr:cardiolipin synthase [Muribaculaceae bacterium]